MSESVNAGFITSISLLIIPDIEQSQVHIFMEFYGEETLLSHIRKKKRVDEQEVSTTTMTTFICPNLVSSFVNSTS